MLSAKHSVSSTRDSKGQGLVVAGKDTMARIPEVIVELPIIDVPLPVAGVPAHDDCTTGDIEDVGAAVVEEWAGLAILLRFDELRDLPELHFVVLWQFAPDLVVVCVFREIKRAQFCGLCLLDRRLRAFQHTLHVVP